MIKELIEIAIEKKGNKKKLGIELGFPEKYATQRVNKLIENQNFKLDLFKKILSSAELLDILDISIAAEHKKLFEK